MTSIIDVSIVVCTRNRGHLLAGALGALAACRSHLDWEVLLVDNASTDNTADVIQAADNLNGKLRYLYAPAGGLGAARDFAWRHARGRLIAFTDDDCYIDPSFVDAVHEAFLSRPEGCLGGRIMLFDQDDLPITIDEREYPVSLPARSFIPAGELQGANLSFRREVLEAIGGFDHSFGAGTPFPCEDVDVVAAAVWQGYSVGFDPRPVVFHHHRRREVDLPAVTEAYDRGRGAYYAKYILRNDSRKTYLIAWLKTILRLRRRSDLLRIYREIKSALTYTLGRPKVV